MSVSTRWNSDCYMIQRLMEEKAPLSAKIALTGKVENFTTHEWKLAEGYVKILTPFEQASRELCSESYPTLSMKTPALHGLHQKLQGFISDIANRGSGISLARTLVASLERSFPSFDEVTNNYLYTETNYISVYFSVLSIFFRHSLSLSITH